MTPATSLARSILHSKSALHREHISEIGKRAVGHPVSVEHRWKAAEAWRRFHAMSAEVRREYYFEKRARYLVNVLVTQGDRRVFRLRCEADGGGMVELETWIAKHAHPVTLLLKLMRMPHAPTVLRLDCAKTTARYLHKPPKQVITVEWEQQRLERRRERKRQYMRRRYHERLSAVAATDEADRAAADG